MDPIKRQKLLALIDPALASQAANEQITTGEFLKHFVKTLKGDDGYTPIKGVDYFTKEEIADFLKGVTPIKFKDYFTEEEINLIIQIVKEQATPVKGVDYFDGEPGKPGKSADETKIVDKVLSKIKIPEQIPRDTAEQIAVKINTLDGKISYKVLKDVPEQGLSIDDVIKELKNPKSKYRLTKDDVSGLPKGQYLHGGGISAIQAGDGITITEYETNKFTITATNKTLNYKGLWDADTNTPTIISSTGTKGDYYIVNVAGTTDLDGVNVWNIGDWAVFNGTVWQKIDNQDTKAVWGAITGNLNDQTDLQNALNAKQNTIPYTTENSANKVTSLSDSSTDIQYPSAKAVHEGLRMQQDVFVGIDQATPVTVSINYNTRVLTVTPVLAYFDFYVDGGGAEVHYRKTGPVNFPAFTDTNGKWYFYFDQSGNPITTQTAWTSFDTIVSVYRLLWNTAMPIAEEYKSVSENIETHENTISASDHNWKHTYGTIWKSGGELANNAVTSGAPDASGLNTCVGLSSVTNIDDNLQYTVTNSDSGANWTQDMGTTTPALLTTLTGGLFNIARVVSNNIIPVQATRFPFAYNGSNLPEYVDINGDFQSVTSGNFFVYFIFANQDQRPISAVNLISAPGQYTTIANAEAVTWDTIKSSFPLMNDNEIRPLYRLVFEYRTNYDIAVKKTVLRMVTDLRKAQVTGTTVAGGSLPASSVTVVPSTNETSTNAQSRFDELSTKGSLNIEINNGTSVITTGMKAIYMPATRASTMSTGKIVCDTTGSVVLKICKKAGAVPTVSDVVQTITLSSAQQDLALASSGVAIAVDDIIGVYVDSCSSIHALAVNIKLI